MYAQGTSSSNTGVQRDVSKPPGDGQTASSAVKSRKGIAHHTMALNTRSPLALFSGLGSSLATSWALESQLLHRSRISHAFSPLWNQPLMSYTLPC